MTKFHATSVAIDGKGLLIFGSPGAGKSDLALRLIDRGALLISDDYTKVSADQGNLFAHTPKTIAGLIEVRGIGLVTLDHVENIPIRLVVNLVDIEKVPRLPDPETKEIVGVALPLLHLNGKEPSAPIKVELALRQQQDG